MDREEKVKSIAQTARSFAPQNREVAIADLCGTDLALQREVWEWIEKPVVNAPLHPTADGGSETNGGIDFSLGQATANHQGELSELTLDAPIVDPADRVHEPQLKPDMVVGN